MNTQSSKQKAKEWVLELVKPGSTVYTILRHVSRSGMQRTIDMIVLTERGPRSIAYQASVLTGSSLDRDRWGLRVRGTGMDMGFDLVYELSYQLFSEGFDCIGESCPSNDHKNGDRDYTPHQHKNGGYALIQNWM